MLFVSSSFFELLQGSEAFNNVRSDFSIVVDYFEKLSLFSAGISRLSSFIKRLGGETDSARSGINHTASPANAQSCIPGLHSAYLFSTSVIRTFVTRFGMSKKSMDSEYSKV